MMNKNSKKGDLVHKAARAPCENTERTIGTIVPVVFKYMEDAVQWYLVLDKVLYAMNNAVNKAAGKAPSALRKNLTERNVLSDKEVRDQAVLWIDSNKKNNKIKYEDGGQKCMKPFDRGRLKQYKLEVLSGSRGFD